MNTWRQWCPMLEYSNIYTWIELMNMPYSQRCTKCKLKRNGIEYSPQIPTCQEIMPPNPACLPGDQTSMATVWRSPCPAYVPSNHIPMPTTYLAHAQPRCQVITPQFPSCDIAHNTAYMPNSYTSIAIAWHSPCPTYIPGDHTSMLDM